jgi:hypothetical protein
MRIKEKLPFIILGVFSFILLSLLLSQKASFSGDEFYTLDVSNVLKPIPYRIFVSIFIENIGIGPDKSLLLRLSSTFFMVIGILLWYIFITNNKRQIFVFTCIIISSSFLLVESFYFRYYSYYFLTSTSTFLFLQLLFKKSLLKKMTFSFVGMCLSPLLLYWFNFFQFASFFIYILFFEVIKNKKIKYILFAISSIVILYIVYNPNILWIVINKIKISNHLPLYDYNSNLNITKGLTFSIAVKPFYSIYQMFFGYTLTPTSQLFIIPLFVAIAISYIYLIKKIYINNKKLIFEYSFIFVIPLFTIFYFLESISPPGFTQLYAKHAMLFYPLLILILLKSEDYVSRKKMNIIIFLVLIAQLSGSIDTFRTEFINWQEVSDETEQYISNQENSIVVVDDITDKIIKYYKPNTKINIINYLNFNQDTLKNIIQNSNIIVLLISDYKTYTPLKLEQVWQVGSSTEPDFKKLKFTLNFINKYFYLNDSYVIYPTFLYFYKRNFQGISKNGISSVWGQSLKDIRMPIINDSGEKILSSKLINSKENIELQSNSKLVLNLENSLDEYFFGDTIGFVKYCDINIPLIKGINIWDIFSDFNGEPVEKTKVFHSWYHSPLISGSIRYNGSLYKHKAQIYYLNLEFCVGSSIKVYNISNKNILRIWTN